MEGRLSRQASDYGYIPGRMGNRRDGRNIKHNEKGIGKNEKGGSGMDVKEQIMKMAERISSDKELQEQFQEEPVKALESVLGIDLPDEIVEQVIQGVKAKLMTDKVSDAMDTLKGFIKK